MDGWHRLCQDDQDVLIEYYDLHKPIDVDEEDETVAERQVRVAEGIQLDIDYNT